MVAIRVRCADAHDARIARAVDPRRFFDLRLEFEHWNYACAPYKTEGHRNIRTTILSPAWQAELDKQTPDVRIDAVGPLWICKAPF